MLTKVLVIEGCSSSTATATTLQQQLMKLSSCGKTAEEVTETATYEIQPPAAPAAESNTAAALQPWF